MKLPRWLVISMIATSAGAMLIAAGWWWLAWPQLTALQFAELVASENRDDAIAMLDNPSDATTFKGAGALELESRTFSDLLTGRQRFRVTGLPYLFTARAGRVTHQPEYVSVVFSSVEFSVEPDLVSAFDAAAATADSNTSPRLAVIRRAPDFALTDQAGRLLASSDLKDKVLLVSFVFTTCNGTCPATTHRMGLAARELQAHGLFEGDRVRLISITLDPQRDTPEVLGRYSRMYDADEKHWSFLTGPPADVAKVIEAWDMWARLAANGQLDHPSRIFLVDTQQRIREIYNLSFLRPDWVADDVRLLLDEAQRPRTR